MAQTYKVFGPCVPMIKIGASASAALGVAKENITITIDIQEMDRKTDAAGAMLPGDIQAMGTQAFIDITLASWDETLLNTLRSMAEGGNVPGTLLGTSGNLVNLWFNSTSDLPWNFASAKLEPTNENPGTVSTDMKLRFRAIRFVPGNANTVSGITLYTRVAASS